MEGDPVDARMYFIAETLELQNKLIGNLQSIATHAQSATINSRIEKLEAYVEKTEEELAKKKEELLDLRQAHASFIDSVTQVRLFCLR